VKLPGIVLLCAGLGIPLALLVFVLPVTWGYAGFNYDFTGPREGVVFYVDPLGPAAKGGIRLHDHVVETPAGWGFIYDEAGTAGTTMIYHVVRPDGVHDVPLTFVRFSGDLAVQERISTWLAALTALEAWIIALLVILRARDSQTAVRAALVLLYAGGSAFVAGAANVCGNTILAFFLLFVGPLLRGAMIWAALSLLTTLTPVRSALRNTLARLGPVALVASCVQEIALTLRLPAFAALGTLKSADFIELALFAVVVAAIVDALMTAPASYRAATRWLGGSWIVAVICVAIPDVAELSGYTMSVHAHDIYEAISVFFLSFGVAYPILRHRLVDLNLIVSRATIFTVVSLIIVSLFVGAEWAIGKVFEERVGFSSERGGMLAQLTTLAVVLILGISARSIHSFVEERLTQVFFRKRIEGLAEIQRVAREADAATDAYAMTNIAVRTIIKTLNPLGSAFYICASGEYRRTSAGGKEIFPPVYEFNDSTTLRLRRWQEPFEADDQSDDRHHVLYVPMTVRGEMIGFLCCGPKPDHTLYAKDEIAALSLLAHHVGLATAWLDGAPLNARVGIASPSFSPA